MAVSAGLRFERLVALLPDRALAAACFAAFVVALGYGIVVPAIPPLLERLLPEYRAAALPLHTGGLTGVYTIAIFLFAPLWGRLSDRLGQRAIACVGLAGYALALVLFLFATDIRVAYVTRILAGIFAAGIGPVIQALVTEAVERAAAIRRFAALGAFTLAGALVGPTSPIGTTAAVSLIAGATGAAQLMLAAETAVAQQGRLATVFGQQLAFASLGQGLGSLTSGALFQWSESATFLGTAGLMGAGAAVLGFGLGPVRWRNHRHPHWDSHA